MDRCSNMLIKNPSWIYRGRYDPKTSKIPLPDRISPPTKQFAQTTVKMWYWYRSPLWIWYNNKDARAKVAHAIVKIAGEGCWIHWGKPKLLNMGESDNLVITLCHFFKCAVELALPCFKLYLDTTKAAPNPVVVVAVVMVVDTKPRSTQLLILAFHLLWMKPHILHVQTLSKPMPRESLTPS